MGVTQKVWIQFQRQHPVVVSKENWMAQISRKGTGNWLRNISVPLFCSVLPVSLNIMWGSGLSDLKKAIVPLENFWKEHQEWWKLWHTFHRKDDSGCQLHWHCSLDWKCALEANLQIVSICHLLLQLLSSLGDHKLEFLQIKLTGRFPLIFEFSVHANNLALVQSKTSLNTLSEDARL